MNYSPTFFELQAKILIRSAVTVSLSNLKVAFLSINVHTSSHDRYTFKFPYRQLELRDPYLEGQSAFDVVGEFIGDGFVKLD
jgi:hypothetical protein